MWVSTFIIPGITEESKTGIWQMHLKMNSNLKGRRQHFFFSPLPISSQRSEQRGKHRGAVRPPAFDMSRKKHKVRPPESHGCFARCDLHSRRHASPVLAVTGNPGTSPRWQPHYSDNSAGWKSFRYVPRDAAMCSVPRDACKTFNSRRCRAVR